MTIITMTIITENNSNNNDNDDNNDNNNYGGGGGGGGNNISTASVSGDLRCPVPHITSPRCYIFTQLRHICIVESSYE